MSTINPAQNDVISFTLVNETINGGPRTAATVTALLNYEMAVLLDPELLSKHRNFYAYIADKVNNVNDPSVYTYIAIRNPNGVTEIIGIPWILDSSYRSASTRQQTYVINNFQENYRATIETMFNNLGISWIGKDTTPE